MQINELSLIIYTYRCDLEKQEKLDGSYTQRRKPYEGGDRGSDDRKKTKGKETIGYAERVFEKIVVCGTKEKGGKQERVENMEAKNLPNGRTLTTTIIIYTLYIHPCAAPLHIGLSYALIQSDFDIVLWISNFLKQLKERGIHYLRPVQRQLNNWTSYTNLSDMDPCLASRDNITRLKDNVTLAGYFVFQLHRLGTYM